LFGSEPTLAGRHQQNHHAAKPYSKVNNLTIIIIMHVQQSIAGSTASGVIKLLKLLD